MNRHDYCPQCEATARANRQHAAETPTGFIVYAIRDPQTSQAFYIGRTNNLPARIANHLHCKTNTSRFTIRSLLNNGLVPTFTIESRHATAKEAYAAERETYYRLKAAGHRLINQDSHIINRPPQ